MASAKIKKGDTVVVLSGKDKGKTGEVTRSLPKDGKVVVQGVNIATRHKKPSQSDPQGGLEKVEAPMHISKVAIWNPGAKKGDRVGIRTLADGKRVRFFKSSGEQLDVK